MILKHLSSFNVAVARLLHKDAAVAPLIIGFCSDFQRADSVDAARGLNLHKVEDTKSVPTTRS